MSSMRDRFPGLTGEWARFDGPAGTLMVDTAIEAMRAYSSGNGTANVGGGFDASVSTGQVVDGARATMAQLLGAAPESIVFGANMTTLTFAFTRAIARSLSEGDEIVCTQLDHDANVTPWVLAAADRGAHVQFAELDRESGRLEVDAVEARLTDRTKWVAVTGASNLIGTMPDITAITKAVHAAGARVFIDAVHMAPHRAIDVRAIGCDTLVTSPYKWYGPHAGVLVVDPALLDSIEAYKVRPAADRGPRRLETGTPSFEAIAGVEAAARFLLDTGMDAMANHEREVFRPLLDGLLSMNHVTVHGPHDLTDRAPTVLFNVKGMHPDQLAKALAEARVATWSGDSYAVEAARALGLTATGVGVRAGVVRYIDDGDVQRLLQAVDRLS
jgi:cysteine desulfurase family protein (TIGR01976 family)